MLAHHAPARRLTKTPPQQQQTVQVWSSGESETQTPELLNGHQRDPAMLSLQNADR